MIAAARDRYSSAKIVLFLVPLLFLAPWRTSAFVAHRPRLGSLQFEGRSSWNSLHSSSWSSFRSHQTSLLHARRIKKGGTAESFETTEPTKKRKKKKNKYAKFSKAEKNELDPFEALVRESEQKLKSIETEKQQKQKEREELPPPPVAATKTLEFPNNKDIDPYDPMTFGFVEIGSIVAPHGVHGWVKVQGCTDFPERLTRAGMPLHMKAARKRAPRKITLASGKFLGDDQFLIQLQGYYDRTAAQALKGSTLYFASQQDTVEREEDDIVLSELIGLSVYRTPASEDEEGEQVLVGTILGVVLAEEMCAIPGLLHDQIEIGVTRKSSDGEAVRAGAPQDLLLVPLVPEIVTKIDLENQMILVDPPKGLLDLTYVREEKVRIKGLLAPAKE